MLMLEEYPKVIEVYADSDWAGCLVSRKSTSGGVIALAGVMLKSWSSTQGSIATSPGEAEYYAALKGSAVDKDLGLDFSLRLWSDSSSAKGIASRRGLSGRTRHIETKYLWRQEALYGKRLCWAKVPTEINPRIF